MSDVVDDLQEAEDHIGRLEVLLARFLEFPGGTELHRLVAEVQAVLDEGWCRPSCGDHDVRCVNCSTPVMLGGDAWKHAHTSPVCGSPTAGDDLEVCGCPCGHGTSTGSDGA